MTSALYNAATTRDSRTENGAVTNSTSGNEVLNYFFTAPVSRNKTEQELIAMFTKAYAENSEQALRALLWSRDVLQGAGERRLFRTILKWLCTKNPKDAKRVLSRTTVNGIGRWDDLFVAMGTELEEYVLTLYVTALISRDRLAAKWAPRKGPIAAKLREFMELSPRNYRKLVVGLSNTVETQMCANLWDEIEYSHVPSVAHSRYRKAFARHSHERYDAYLNRVRDPESTEKINAKAVFPHEVVGHELFVGGRMGNIDATTLKAIETQWDALPNFVSSDESIMPVIDVSGSMWTPVGPGSKHTILQVAVTLGLYVSERLNSVFKDHFITFSTNPKLQLVRGSIVDRMSTICRADWQMSTNVYGAFKLIVDTAVKHGLKNEDLPTKLLVLSDMEFDSCGGKSTNFDAIDQLYAKHGYTRPQLVFWNLGSRSSGNFPVKVGTAGTALVSGFSPTILKSVMEGSLDPMKVVLKTIMSERYEC